MNEKILCIEGGDRLDSLPGAVFFYVFSSDIPT